MAMNPAEVAAKQSQLIGKFPNTYTYTKNLTEKAILKEKGNLNVVIFRPSIIAASSKEPFEGWTDSTAAAGGISLMICLGVITQIDETGESKADIIPVDIVSNGIIITTAHCA